MICPKCKYSWVSKVSKPKCCPKCKQFIDYNLEVDKMVLDEMEVKELLQKRILILTDQITGKKYTTTLKVVE